MQHIPDYRQFVNEGVNLKASHLSSEDYQKAKKLKAFDSADWAWNSKSQLYDKVNESVVTEAKFTRLPKQLNAMWELKNSVENMVGRHDNGDDYDPNQMRTIEEFIKKIKKSAKSFKSKEEVVGTIYESNFSPLGYAKRVVAGAITLKDAMKEAGISLSNMGKLIKKIDKKFDIDAAFLESKVNEGPGKGYYIKVSVRDAKKALAILDDMYRKKFDINGSNVYYFKDEDMAYDAKMDLAARDIEIIDTNIEESLDEDADPCWDDYKIGSPKTKISSKSGKRVNNCVPKDESEVNEADDYKYKKYVSKAFDKISDAMFEFRNAMGVKQLGQADPKLKKRLEAIQTEIFALRREMKSEGLTESEVTEGIFDSIADPTKALHFETDPKRAELMKMELGKKQGETNKKKQIEGGEYSLRKFRKEIKYDTTGKDLGVFRPGSYMSATSTIGDGPHKKAVAKIKWNQKKYDQWLEDVASNDGWKNAFDMAQNAKQEPGLISWVKKTFRVPDPMQRIQWDIESFAESVDESAMSELDILAKEAKDFKAFTKEVFKEFKNLPKKADTLKWLEELYNDAINEAEKAEGDRSKLSADIEKALKDKATESGVPIGLLRLVMRRGLDAWNSSHRAGVPQVAWGYARVNAFLEKGKGTWGKADADIAKEVRDEGKADKLPIKNPSEFTKKEREA